MNTAVRKDYDVESGHWLGTNIMINIEPRCLSIGGIRKVYRLSIKHDNTQYVIKSFIHREDQKLAYDEVILQKEATRWANLFNSEKVPKKVKFLNTFIICYGRDVYCAEKYIPGLFEKHNSNFDFWNNYRNTPQAFTHYTWEKSKHKLLVCDIQGVGDVWTDAQILTVDGKGYGTGNIGRRGINMFLKMHTCNDLCKFLKLPRVNSKISDQNNYKITYDNYLRNFRARRTKHLNQTKPMFPKIDNRYNNPINYAYKQTSNKQPYPLGILLIQTERGYVIESVIKDSIMEIYGFCKGDSLMVANDIELSNLPIDIVKEILTDIFKSKDRSVIGYIRDSRELYRII